MNPHQSQCLLLHQQPFLSFLLGPLWRAPWTGGHGPRHLGEKRLRGRRGARRSACRRRGDRRQLRVQDLGARLRRECRAVGHHGGCSISRLRGAISTRLSHSVVPEHHAERHARRGRRAATPCGRSPSPLVSWRRSSLRAREPEALRRPCFDSRLRGCRLRLHARARRCGLKTRAAPSDL